MATPTPTTIKTTPITTSHPTDPFRKTCLVPYVDPSTASQAVAEKLSILPFRRNIFYLLGNSPGLFPPLASLIGSCFSDKSRTIPLLDWQLIVLRTATTLGAKYEYDVNLPVAEVYEMDSQKIELISGGVAPEDVRGGKGPWTERERIVLRMVDEQLASYTNEEETIRDALRVMGHGEVVEILIVIGLYALIARVINGLRIEDDAEIPGLKDMLRKSVK